MDLLHRNNYPPICLIPEKSAFCNLNINFSKCSFFFVMWRQFSILAKWMLRNYFMQKLWLELKFKHRLFTRTSPGVSVLVSGHVRWIFRLKKFTELPAGVCSETLDIPFTTKCICDGFGGLVVRMLASGSRVRGFKPGRSCWLFLYIKILSMPSFGGEVT
jgi:hypothetical protein